MSSKKVYEILKNKGVASIYHANTVITSCQFLRNRSLLSRGTINRKGMYQTPQISDKNDRKFGIWFDVFTDSVDIHQRAKRANLYGPVLFVLDSELIKKTYTGKIWVTKLNPIKWLGRRYKERWFTSAEDLEENFVLGDFNQMIVFRHCGGELPFKDYLLEIILDNPKLESNHIDYYSMAYGALKLAMTEGRIDVRIKKRKCPIKCTCLDEYKTNISNTKQMFIPKI